MNPNANPVSNPFVRGYNSLSIQRMIAIAYDDDCPLTYLPLHASQSHLRDDEIVLFTCIFCDDFALVSGEQSVPDELNLQCRSHGVARTVVYAVMADDSGTPVHVGDTYSEEAARNVVRRLRFDTGHYSRCWEISSGHLPEETMQYLEDLADTSTLTGLLFEAFRIPDSDAVGVKLIATPWTDANLKIIDGRDAQALHNEQADACVPSPLLNVLHLAAMADVRILIFDPNAAILDGLPVYEE
ncbi:MAG: ABC transporter substrate-binding protein [Polycyclovorans sp.]|nr:ABC transporter substrate-binding protein [Polycyclovorans sp.]|tara:strand:+ start:10606 stop:11331 length:726 start_codon:yes stop_codon:yes gene_type:complete